jgi:hypothetical protein
MGDVITMIHDFGTDKFSFKHLFKDEKRKILKKIMERSLPPVETVIKDYYDDNYQLMIGIFQSNIAIPEGWKNITQFVINRELSALFTNGNMNVRKLKSLASEYKRWNVQLTDKASLSLAAGERIYKELLKAASEHTSLEKIHSLIDILKALDDIDIDPELWKSQNEYYKLMKGYVSGEWVFASEEWKRAFLKIGEQLNMAVD